MNAISSAGLHIAGQISSAYFDNLNVKAIILGGSVARGCADQYSDLELGVFWNEAPSAHEREAAIERVGGELWTFDREPGNEHYGLNTLTLAGKLYTGTAMISTQHGMIGDVEKCFSEVIDHYDTSVGKQALISAIQHAVPFYYPSSEHKWMDELIGQMKFTPPDLSRRMNEVFRLEPLSGWQQLKSLMEDTLTLVESHLPEVNQVSLFKEHPEINIAWARQRWNANPPYNLMEHLSASQEA